MKKHKDALDQAQAASSGWTKPSSPPFILVETRLGTYLGNRTVINTLSTMAALSENPALQERIWDAISDKKKPKRERPLIKK